MALFAAPLWAQSEIEFDPDITDAEFQKFNRIVAQGIYPTPVQPARAAGLLGFDIGIAATVIEVDDTASYWVNSVNEDFSSGNYVGVPRLVVSKGFSFFSLSGSYAKLGDSDIDIIGGALDVPIIEGGLLKPTLAVRGSYATLRGIDEYNLKTYGVELFLSKGFGPVTPYGAIGRVRNDGTGVTALINQPLSDKSDVNRYTVGVRISLLLPKIAIEATQGEERSYAAKVSIGF